MEVGIFIGILIAIALFIAFGLGVKVGGEAAKERIEMQLGDKIDSVKRMLNGHD